MVSGSCGLVAVDAAAEIVASTRKRPLGYARSWPEPPASSPGAMSGEHPFADLLASVPNHAAEAAKQLELLTLPVPAEAIKPLAKRYRSPSSGRLASPTARAGGSSI